MEDCPIEGVVVASDPEADEMLLLPSIICKRDEDSGQGKSNIEVHTVPDIVSGVRGEGNWYIVESL